MQLDQSGDGSKFFFSSNSNQVLFIHHDDNYAFFSCCSISFYLYGDVIFLLRKIHARIHVVVLPIDITYTRIY